MNNFKVNTISKSDFLNINESDVLFITNPGRMGDEDGSTFIVKHNNELTIYRIDGWMYPRKGEKVEVSLDDALKQFPKWHEAWKNGDEENYKEKYKYMYMGFGNGLCVDNSIYDDFEPYLNKLVKEYLEKRNDDDKESLKYAAIFDVWEKAFIDMVKDKGYVLR